MAIQKNLLQVNYKTYMHLKGCDCMNLYTFKDDLSFWMFGEGFPGYFFQLLVSKFGELLKILLLTVFQNKNLRSLFSMMISKLRSRFVFTAYAIVDLIYYQTHRMTRETSSYLTDVLLLLYL